MTSISDPRSHCLSFLVFDRLLAGEETGLEGARRHLEECDSCRDHLLALERERDDALRPEAVAAGVDAIIGALEQKKGGGVVSLSRYKLALWGGIAMAAAASLALIINMTELGGVHPDPMGRDGVTPADGVRIKGSSSFQVLVVHEGNGRILSHGDTVESGDVLVFKVSVSREQYVSLAGIGEQGSAYFLNHQYTAPWKVLPGESFQLPVSAELDEQPGSDRVFAFFCENPGLPESALESIDELYKLGEDNRRTLVPERLPALKSCETRSFLVRRSSSDDVKK